MNATTSPRNLRGQEPYPGFDPRHLTSADSISIMRPKAWADARFKPYGRGLRMNLKDSSLFREQCYINGAWVDADDGGTIEVDNPADNSVVGTIPKMGAAETRRAIEAGQRGLSGVARAYRQGKGRGFAKMVRPGHGESGRPRRHDDHGTGPSPSRNHAARSSTAPRSSSGSRRKRSASTAIPFRNTSTTSASS